MVFYMVHSYRIIHYNTLKIYIIRINRNKRYTYKYYFFWDHDESLDTEHVKDPNKSEYVIIRGGKRSVFYEDINRREQIPNDKK